MEKYAVWFGLLLKKNLKKKTVYIQSIVLIVLLLLLQLIHIPNSDNTKIGVCLNDNDVAKIIYDNLSGQIDTYDFVEYKNRELLEKAVTSGKVECGFYFTDDFDDCFENGKIKDIVEFWVTPMSAKADLIRENFYISFLKQYSEVLLLQSEEELYGENSAERTNDILSLNQQYLDGDELFELDIRYVETKGQKDINETQTFFLQGMYGIVVFLFMFLSYNKGNRNNASDFRTILNKKDGVIFDIQELISVGLLPAVSGLLVILFTKESRGAIVEILATCLLLVVSTIWILLFAFLCKNEVNYLSMFLIISMTQIIVCPIFWDISRYSKVLEYIRYLFPVGMYLLL